MKLILYYLLIINVLGLWFMLWDKLQARKMRWRIPEARLMLTALVGGSLGILLGMHLFRHKTLHPKFAIGVPVILALQIVLALLIFSYCI